MSFFWERRHSRMHSLQKMWPFWQHKGSMNGFKQRQHASKGFIESLPSRSFCVPYPSLRFSSYVKKARSLLFFECLCGIVWFCCLIGKKKKETEKPKLIALDHRRETLEIAKERDRIRSEYFCLVYFTCILKR